MFTRRNLLQAGASACLLAAAEPALAALPRIHYGTGFSSTGINPRLLARARAALNEKRRFLRYTDTFAVADFSKASGEERFYLVDSASGDVTSFHVCHGRGSDPEHSGYLNHFSNAPGSEASSAGAYVTGDFYQGKYGRSLKLKGLDYSNSNAEARNIVMHHAPYAEPEILRQYGKLGRSEGCFALSRDSLRQVTQRLGPGRLLYSDKV